MAYIIPFRALRYDPKRVSPASVVTQPYDKITPAMQERYYTASPYNLVRLILGKRDPADNAEQNVYSRASGFFRDWRREGVFLQDAEPSIYAYSQTFRVPGTNREVERSGFIALGRVEDYAANVVFRHEQTLAKPKADRLDLLRATQAHFGQIFMLYNDTGEIDSLLAQQAVPTTEFTDDYGVLNRLWRISDPRLIDSVRDKMRDKQLIIAGPEFIWHYDRDLETVTRRPVTTDVEMTPLQILGGDDAALREKFQVVRKAEGTFQLTPLAAGIGFKQLTLYLNKTQVTGMEIRDNLDQDVVITFADLDSTSKLSSADFAFTPPEGADRFYYDE